MEDLLGQHLVLNEARGSYELAIGESRISMVANGSSSSGLFYRRYSEAGELVSESLVASDENTLVLGVFPSPPLYTPKCIANNMYLKFKSSIIVDQKSDVVLYTTMPIEIAVYRQSRDEEILLDAFALQRQKYAVYGSPEAGVVCRYNEVEVKSNKDEISPARYKEALVRIAIRNEIDNIVKVNKVIIPMDNTLLNHVHDDSWLPGTVEMSLNQTFGKDVISVRMVDAKTKPMDKTSIAGKQDSMTFLMDAGY